MLAMCVSYQEGLRRMLESCEGAVAGAVIDSRGRPVESITRDAAVDMEAVGREFGLVLEEVRKAASMLEAGALEELSIRSERLTLILRVIDQDHLLGLAIRPDGNFGKGRFLVRTAQPTLRAQP